MEEVLNDYILGYAEGLVEEGHLHADDRRYCKMYILSVNAIVSDSNAIIRTKKKKMVRAMLFML
jgi:hypothetical protein